MGEIPHQRLFRFGIFEADLQTGELRKQGRRMPLQGQPFDILVMLLEQPGQVVSRAAIRERLWSDDTFVDYDHSLNTAVNKIRDVLGDSAASPRFIETLARRGYRFIAPVQVEGQDAAPPRDRGDSPLPIPAVSEPAQQQPAVREVALKETLLTGSHEIPHTPRSLVRTLFLLLQLMYFCFYLISLARLHVVEEIFAATFTRAVWMVVLLIVTAVVGIPVRLYLISTVAFNAPGLRQKFPSL